MRAFILKVFGWVPIPGQVIKLLPKRYKENYARNFLVDIKVVSIILDAMESRGYSKEEGSKYSSVEEEVEATLKTFPQLRPYKIYFTRYCERKRKEVGLTR